MIQKETWYLDAIPQSDGRNKKMKYTPVSLVLFMETTASRCAAIHNHSPQNQSITYLKKVFV